MTKILSLINPSMATVFGRIESMRYTSYVQECLRILEAGKEYDTDVNLVFLVRIQHLIQRISDLNPRDTTVEEFTSVPKAPAPVYVSSYKNELERLRDGLPDHLKNDSKFLVKSHMIQQLTLIR